MLQIWERKKNVFWGLPIERSHRKVVILALSNSKLLLEVCEVVEFMTGIELLVVFPVAAFYLAIVPGCVWLDQFVPNAELIQGFFK